MKSVKPTQELPEGYGFLKDLNLAKNQQLMTGLSIASLVLFVFFGLLFLGLLAVLREDFSFGMQFSFNVGNLWTIIVPLLVLVAIIFGMVVLHEAVHGLFFWLFTGGHVKFGFKGPYAYAAAPDWYIPKLPYLIVSLAPLVVISIAGMIALLWLPESWIFPVLLLITMNASGAAGDMYAFYWVLQLPDRALIRDFGERMRSFAPQSEGSSDQEEISLHSV